MKKHILVQIVNSLNFFKFIFFNKNNKKLINKRKIKIIIVIKNPYALIFN